MALSLSLSGRAATCVAGALVLGAAGLSACGQASSSAASGGKTLTVDTSFVVKSLDPGQVYEETGNVTVHALYDTLVTFDGSDISKPVPDLAKSFTRSSDGKTFTFTLRSDAVFSDGSSVTSADVVFSLKRLQNLKGSPAAIVTGLSFSAPDPKTVVVTSATVNPDVPTILAEPYAAVIEKKVALAHGGTDAPDASKTDTLSSYLDKTSAGSGPYVLSSFDASSQIVLTANPKYWGPAPAFSRVVFQNMDVQNQKLTMSKQPKNQIALDLTGDALTGLPSQLQVSGSADTYYQLRLDADPSVSKVTSNRDYVNALQAAIDYQGLAKLFGPSGQPAAGVVPSAYAGALPQSAAQTQNLSKAKQLLARSGVGGQTVKLLYPALTYSGVDLGTIAAKVQSDAAKAGIKIQLDPAPIASFLDQRRGAKVAMSFSPQSLNYPVAASIVADLMPGGATAAAAGWTAKEADPATVAAAKKVLADTDPTQQVADLQAWQRLMIHNSPYVTLAYSRGTAVASPNLSGAQYTAAGWVVDVADVGTK